MRRVHRQLTDPLELAPPTVDHIGEKETCRDLVVCRLPGPLVCDGAGQPSGSAASDLRDPVKSGFDGTVCQTLPLMRGPVLVWVHITRSIVQLRREAIRVGRGSQRKGVGFRVAVVRRVTGASRGRPYGRPKPEPQQE